MVELKVNAVPLNGMTFFDSPSVLKRISKAKRQRLSRLGAFTRTRARSSIRPAKVLNRKNVKAGAEPIYEPSKPGQPPRTRRPGAPLKKILFGYEPDGGPDDGGNVAIGYGLAFGTKTGTPHRLEFSGEFAGRHGRKVKVAKRPALTPALAIERAKAGPLFADSL